MFSKASSFQLESLAKSLVSDFKYEKNEFILLYLMEQERVYDTEPNSPPWLEGKVSNESDVRFELVTSYYGKLLPFDQMIEVLPARTAPLEFLKSTAFGSLQLLFADVALIADEVPYQQSEHCLD